MRKTNFYHNEYCLWHSGTTQYAGVVPVGRWVAPPSASGLSESPESKRRMKNLLEAGGFFEHIPTLREKTLAKEDLLRIHPEHYLDKFKKMSDNGGGELGNNAPIGPRSYEIAMISAGLATAAVEDVFLGKADNAYALSRPPGHHCLSDEAMGFCFLANIPIAVEYARAHHKLGKVVILDWDVHHGNGTQAIYYDDPNTLTISIHQEGCFPPGYSGEEDRGEDKGDGYNINIPLPAGGGDDIYRYALETLVLPQIRKFKPDIIIVACGFDANAFDPLARMLLHSDTYKEMTKMMQQVADEVCDGKLVMVHEGGYAESYVPFCGVGVMESLLDWESPVEDPMIDFIKEQQPSETIQKFHKDWVDQLRKSFE